MLLRVEIEPGAVEGQKQGLLEEGRAHQHSLEALDLRELSLGAGLQVRTGGQFPASQGQIHRVGDDVLRGAVVEPHLEAARAPGRLTLQESKQIQAPIIVEIIQQDPDPHPAPCGGDQLFRQPGGAVVVCEDVVGEVEAFPGIAHRLQFLLEGLVIVQQYRRGGKIKARGRGVGSKLGFRKSGRCRTSDIGARCNRTSGQQQDAEPGGERQPPDRERPRS